VQAHVRCTYYSAYFVNMEGKEREITENRKNGNKEEIVK
jgi:hypothetical protein